MERKIKFVENEYYHLYSRGVEKRKIFLNFKDYERFVAILYIMNQKDSFNFANFLKSHKLNEIFNEDRAEPLVSILSYVLMPNHFHILVYEHTEGGISKFMMKVLTAYSMYFNIKYKRSGPLFMHPFRSQHVSGESQYLWIFSYIHLNPLKLMIQDTPKSEVVRIKSTEDEFLKSYQYSSYLEYGGEERSQSKILDRSSMPEYLLNLEIDSKRYKELAEENQIIEGYPQ